MVVTFVDRFGADAGVVAEAGRLALVVIVELGFFGAGIVPTVVLFAALVKRGAV